jgi:multimeric flavodoxin WrbA
VNAVTDGLFVSPPGDPSAPDCVLACSPRRTGNTDTAADLVRDALREGESRPCEVRRVADLPLRPCSACGLCDARPGECSLDKEFFFPPAGAAVRDEGLPLLRALCRAPVACLISPLYFYHFPGQAKCLLDRAQTFRTLPPARKPGAGKTLGVVLLGGRSRGEKMFAGALLSLRYVADSLGMNPAEPLLLRGLDETGALRRRPAAQRAIRAYALFLKASVPGLSGSG